MHNRIVVSAADFIRNIGRWQSEAMRQPVFITHHGRERLMLASPDHVNGREGGDAAPESNLELKALHAALIEAMEEGYVVLDAQRSIEAVNDVAAAFVGRPRDELIGLSVLDVFPHLLGLILSDRAQRVQRTRKAEAFAFSPNDGGQSLSVRVAPALDRLVVLFHNTTELERLQREREDTEALLKALRAHPRIASIRLDARGRIESVDDAFCGWTGFAAAELAGHRLADLVPGVDRRAVTLALENVMRGGEEELSFTILGKRGDPARFEMMLSPVLSDFVARGAVAVLLPARAAKAEPAFEQA